MISNCIRLILLFLLFAFQVAGADESLVSQRSVSCKLPHGQFILNLALTPDNIESNKAAIFGGSYLGKFDAQANSYSDPRPREKLYESIYRRAYQLKDIANCIDTQGQSIALPAIESSKLKFDGSIKDPVAAAPAANDHNADKGFKTKAYFKAEVDRITGHFRAGQWVEGMNSLRAIAQILETPLWKDSAGSAEIQNVLIDIRRSYLPDGLAICHKDWNLRFESIRVTQKGRILRHFANRLCDIVGLPATDARIADIILLDALLPDALDERSQGNTFFADAISDDKSWKKLMQGLILTPKAQRILATSRQASPVLASEGFSEAEISSALIQQELKFYQLQSAQSDLIITRFKLHALEKTL